MVRPNHKDAVMVIFRNINWKDVSLHFLGGVILTFVLSFMLPIYVAIIFNALFWFVREVIQDYNKGHKWPFIWPLRWSTQKFWEFVAPTLGGFLILLF